MAFSSGSRQPPHLSFCLALALATVASVMPREGARAEDSAPLTVFAAASLTNALEDIGALWRNQGKGEVRFSFAASSVLARQIEQGAGADLFASADEQWMDYLAERNLIVPATRTSFLGNRLVLVAPADTTGTVEIGPGLDLAALLGDGRLATGDPEHVPAGRYAREALTKLGLWQAAEPRLARAENVRAALVLVERGEAPFGIVYATDAVASSKVRVAGVFPDDSHAPISYPIAVVAGRDSPTARAFLDFLGGVEAREVFARRGFLVQKGPGSGS